MKKQQLPEPPPSRRIGIITAKEAKELADANKKKEVSQNWVFSKIKRRAKRGLHYTVISELNGATEKELLVKGFSITSYKEPGQYGKTIRW